MNGVPSFEVPRRRYRPEKYRLAGGMGEDESLSAVSLEPAVIGPDSEFGDSTSLMAGDILELGSERVEVINSTPDRIVIKRGSGGTTAADHESGEVATLIKNVRGGSEILSSNADWLLPGKKHP